MNPDELYCCSWYVTSDLAVPPTEVARIRDLGQKLRIRVTNHSVSYGKFVGGDPYEERLERLIVPHPGSSDIVTVNFLRNNAGQPAYDPEDGNPQFAITTGDPRLHFLMFDLERQQWILTCGGEDFCWWCREDVKLGHVEYELPKDEEAEGAAALASPLATEARRNASAIRRAFIAFRAC